MRTQLSALLIVAGLVSAQSASAADLPAQPVYKAPAAVIAQSWAGFYAGINGGWARGRTCWTFDPSSTADPEGCHNPDGAVVGGQIGYNWQFGNAVFGLEAAGDWADLKGSNESISFSFVNHTKVDAIGMFTGRIGWAGWNSTLLYVKGGAAVAHNKYITIGTVDPTMTATSSDTRWGWVVGTGIEYAFMPNWSIAAEYDYLDLGSKTDTLGNFSASFTCSATCQEKITQNIHMVTARLNYRFWTGR